MLLVGAVCGKGAIWFLRYCSQFRADDVASRQSLRKCVKATIAITAITWFALAFISPDFRTHADGGVGMGYNLVYAIACAVFVPLTAIFCTSLFLLASKLWFNYGHRD
ncbi:hypothetical protein FHS27_006589 [Rhodopirellula rubra]|uniref:Uncharacterized protein n=1 Tax=Aporhodopirellula rubra TaxID=980271 RepID=A0A7W5HA33_9BACT|nr:hypothetical protein [Aporhodopirellula rubra]